MNQIDHGAKELGYATFIIHDLGTPAAAAGSATVLLIAPVPAGQVSDVIPAGLRPLPETVGEVNRGWNAVCVIRSARIHL